MPVMLVFDIDPDIRRAQTPPAGFYTSPEVFNAPFEAYQMT